jgi:hypothetical protein
MIASSRVRSKRGIAIFMSALFSFNVDLTLSLIFAGSRDEVRRDIINYLEKSRQASSSQASCDLYTLV